MGPKRPPPVVIGLNRAPGDDGYSTEETKDRISDSSFYRHVFLLQTSTFQHAAKALISPARVTRAKKRCQK
jgi:hypothetical protein